MTTGELRQALRSGQTVVGTLIVSTSPFWPKIIKDCGLDFIFIDTEHIAIDRERLSWMCRTYAALGLPPLVRITDQDPNQATMVLDDGAAGLIAPYVETEDVARTLRGATKFRPLKGGRLEAVLSGRELEPGVGNYISERSSDNILILNTESVPAIESLDAILDTEGIDAVLIGPHDLSTSLGIPEQYQDKRFLKAAETIFKKARARNVGAGIHAWFSLDEHVRFVEMGANMLIHKADVIFFRQGMMDEMGQLRERLGIAGGSDGGEDVSI